MTTSKLLGEILREEGCNLSRSQVVEVLREQVIRRDRGEPRRIGELLVARGFVGQEELDIALQKQMTYTSK